MKEFSLPKNFLLGSATAATQIDGGDYYSDWYYWALGCNVKNCESPITADEHYILYKEDMAWLKDLKHEVYRFSIDWSRIEPIEGEWNEGAIQHYRNEIGIMLRNGIKPLLTIHHFSVPMWFQTKVGWHNPKSVEYFTRYVYKLIKSIGDLVAEYCTINEPNVLTLYSYITGVFPPGIKNNLCDYFKSSKHLIIAHLKSYKLIHSLRRQMGYTDTKIGFALNMPYLQSKTPITFISKAVIEYLFLTAYEVGFVEGKLIPPFGTGYPMGKGRYCDFFGINYYTRFFVELSPNPSTLFTKVVIKKDLSYCERSDIGWEIYPKGIRYVVKDIGDKYDIPIYITENGIADAKDTRRAKFIYNHLLELSKSISQGYKVEEYYHWSLLDNFEWDQGYFPRYGLLAVCYENQKRTNRQSSKFYTRICKHKKVTKELINRYLTNPENC